jgi:DNA-binding winged helix-turn-helix (wHTH) protein/tetratricopeptide (TPR) repeat protein
MSSPQWCFDRFRLDPSHARLWRGSEVVALPPKAFGVLQYLVTHPDRLVTKDELLDAVWPQTTVSEAVVRVAIGALRKALHDTTSPYGCIATVPRRGYRFLAPVTLIDSSATPAPPLPCFSPPLLVEREAVLQQLHMCLADAQQGRRQVVFIMGEPGIGKTAVVETFIGQVATRTPLWLASGQCVEHYGAGEAYLPVLEAMEQLCRGPGGERLVALLLQQAPTWAMQMPWLLTAAHRAQLHDELQGVTRERMLREFAAVVDTLTAETPLVFILEDLHWSDYATLDLLALLARRRTPAHLLVIGTYRPGEALAHHHPLRTVIQDLQQHRYATECPLALLSPAAVAVYLAARFPQHQFPVALASWLQERTGGNPLFLVTLVQAFVDQGVLHTHTGCWTVQEDLVTLAGVMPDSLRQVLEQQITRLPPAAQRVLEVASVAGVEFVAGVVAAGLEVDANVVEEHCETLVAQQLLRPLGATRWPNGMVATRYAFRHALYQQAVYERLGAGRRVRLHQRLGVCLETAYGTQANEIATELAAHFERSCDARRAVHYLYQAAEKATQRYAPREVITLLTRALALLRSLPETPERAQQELTIQITLGPALITTRGYAALEVVQTYARAHVLCQQVQENPQLVQTLAGLSLFQTVQGEHQTAQEIGRHLLSLVQRLNDPVALLNAYCIRGLTALYLGDLGSCRDHLEQGIALDDRLTNRPLALNSLWDVGVVCRVGVAWALQQLGYPDQAHQRSQEAMALAQVLASPFNRCNLLLFLALFHLFRCEWHIAQHRVEEALSLATAYGFLFYVAVGTIVQGATLAAQNQGQGGLSHIRQGLTACHTMGAKSLRPWGLAMLAEGYGRLGQPAAGLTVLDEAQALIATTSEEFYAAEIARLQGELHLQAGCQVPDAQLGTPSSTAAEACFQHALQVARRQQARWWELRAAMSLGRLWQHQGKRAAARHLLEGVYSWFTEGFEMPDLLEAKALLEELGG